MWQFAEATRGLADGCPALGVPVTGGNVSFYNQTGTAAIHPTPVVGVLGVLDDVRHRVGTGFRRTTRSLSCCSAGPGSSSAARPGRSAATATSAAVPHARPGRRAPAGRASSPAAAADGLLSAAHDLSDGGLAVALAESCLRGGTGCTVRLPEDPFTALFSESAARAVVAVRPGSETALGQLAEAHGASPAAAIGSTGGDSLTVDGCFAIPLAELAAVHTSTLPALFGPVLSDPVVPGSAAWLARCLPGDRIRADRTASRPYCARWTRAPIPSRTTGAARPGTCCTRWPRATLAASWRYGSRRWPPCSACPARCTPGGRRECRRDRPADLDPAGGQRRRPGGAVRSGAVHASGPRADLAPYLPLVLID